MSPTPPTAWPDRPAHRDWLRAECLRLLDFGRRSTHPHGGTAWLDATGSPDLTRPVHTYLTARAAHVYALGHLMGVPGCGPLADAALAGLRGPLRDDDHGGWYPSVSLEGVAAAGKACYDHVFVVLAASSATVAGRPGAEPLLTEALQVFDERFWDPAAGRCVDAWDTAWTTLDPYRGVNGNMHAVEALLAASDATGDPQWRDRALSIAGAVVGWALDRDWRIPEHFDAAWVPQPDCSADRPDDPFKPYGATVGHGLEWSRLLLHLEAALGESAPDWLLPAAQGLFTRADADGWAVDGAPGFVYTTDWEGAPVVRDRLHWVLAEALGAAAALHRRTGDPAYDERYRTWWDYAATYVLDREHGSWHHQLDPHNVPATTVWSGKPDLYHAVQATLLPLLPLAPGLAKALSGG